MNKIDILNQRRLLQRYSRGQKGTVGGSETFTKSRKNSLLEL